MKNLINGHHYVEIIEGVSSGSGRAYYDVDTKKIIDIAGENHVRQKFLNKISRLLDYIISTKETPYTFEEFCNILCEVKFLCHYKNLESTDEDDENKDGHETIGEHINRMENEYLQCDNANVFIIGKEMWPSQ